MSQQLQHNVEVYLKEMGYGSDIAGSGQSQGRLRLEPNTPGTQVNVSIVT